MSTWAYQVENFEPSPDEELVCSICQGVFNDPVQSHCQHIFCRSCLSQWLVRSHTCPVCRQTVSALTIYSAPPLVRSLISKLQVKCPACVRNPMSMEDAAKHRCPEALVRCRVCRGMVKRSLILDHSRRTCPQRHEQCLKCRLKLPPRPAEKAASAYPARTPKHDCTKALRKKLKELSDELKDINKRNRKLLERIQQLEQISTRSGNSSPSSLSDDDNIMSDSLLSNDEEVVINIESIEDSTSSGEEGDDSDIGRNLPERALKRRMKEFRSIVSELFKERRSQSVPLDEFNQYVIEKADQQQPFTPEGISAALNILEEANQVMVANNIVFLI